MVTALNLLKQKPKIPSPAEGALFEEYSNQMPQ